MKLHHTKSHVVGAHPITYQLWNIDSGANGIFSYTKPEGRADVIIYSKEIAYLPSNERIQRED